ncbi:MAG: dATP/dGTP pyrophosphohydrolase domain-containing protein [Pseudomonadota bacterium]
MSDPHSYRTNFRELAHAHAAWSDMTFGTPEARGPIGSLKHLAKEVQEALDHPYDASEYADLFLLVLDSSRRAGISPLGLVAQAFAKLDANMLRDWPVDEDDEPVEHVRQGDLPENAGIRVTITRPNRVRPMTASDLSEVQGWTPHGEVE